MAEKKTYGQLAVLTAWCPAVGTVWRHYKGGVYRVTGSAVLEATQQALVLYQPLEGGEGVTFARPYREWSEEVAWGGEVVKRFAPVTP